MKYMVVTDIKTKLPYKEVMRYARKRIALFKQFPSLTRKFWTYCERHRAYHGVIEFKNKKAAQNFIKSEFAKNISKTYKTIRPIKFTLLKVMHEKIYRN